MERVTAAILSGAPAFSAADTFDAFTQLNALKCAARVEMAKVDFLIVPSAAHHYTVAGMILFPLRCALSIASTFISGRAYVSITAVVSS